MAIASKMLHLQRNVNLHAVTYGAQCVLVLRAGFAVWFPFVCFRSLKYVRAENAP